ncbi:hypothetical protein JZ751_009992 [Albula glossodonta]|uniref:Hyaluronidase n=1 Tax=Albula glossodonta TaxID=121402 RepID=A0A8T2N818_9TELE|nr:hypothetical protein JZ751_009992 [Albula glossodonta]
MCPSPWALLLQSLCLLSLLVPDALLAQELKPTPWPLFSKKPVLLAWNAPTEDCVPRHGIHFKLNQFQIVASPNEGFVRQNLTIFYKDRLGLYPYYEGDGKAFNGGLPQTASLTEHLEKMPEGVTKYIREVGAKGLAVIDWEEWRPLWIRNWHTKDVYRNQSSLLIAKKNPSWSADMVAKVAQQEFELSAKKFMLETLRFAKSLRPNQLWGFYLFPDCYNHGYKTSLENYTGRCPDVETVRNNQLAWLWTESTALYPSIYMASMLRSTSFGRQFVRNRMKEGMRLASVGEGVARPVFVYTRPTYANQLTPLTEARFWCSPFSGAQSALYPVLMVADSPSRGWVIGCSITQGRRELIRLRGQSGEQCGGFRALHKGPTAALMLTLTFWVLVKHLSHKATGHPIGVIALQCPQSACTKLHSYCLNSVGADVVGCERPGLRDVKRASTFLPKAAVPSDPPLQNPSPDPHPSTPSLVNAMHCSSTIMTVLGVEVVEIWRFSLVGTLLQKLCHYVIQSVAACTPKGLGSVTHPREEQSWAGLGWVGLGWAGLRTSIRIRTVCEREREGERKQNRDRMTRLHVTHGSRKSDMASPHGMLGRETPQSRALPGVFWEKLQSDLTPHHLGKALTTDLVSTIGESVALGAAGVILWGDAAYASSKATCRSLSNYLQGQLGQYLLNVSTAAEQCSKALCASRGRCLRRRPDDDVYLHLSSNSQRIVTEGGELRVSGQPDAAETDQLRENFRCQCYSGYRGDTCANAEPGMSTASPSIQACLPTLLTLLLLILLH